MDGFYMESLVQTGAALMVQRPLDVENQLCRLFAGLGRWPNLDDRLIEAGFRVMEASIDQGLDEAGIFLGGREYPEFLDSSTLAGMITSGICEAHPGFLLSDHLEAIWAVRSPPASASASFAISSPAELWQLDPERRQGYRWGLENEYLNLSAYGFPEDNCYWREFGERLDRQIDLQHTETALRLMLQLAAAVARGECADIVLDVAAIGRDAITAKLFAQPGEIKGELGDALDMLHGMRWAKVEFAAYSWRPQLGDPRRVVEGYRWVDESHVVVSVSSGIVDLVRLFSVN